jgi:hypothetical protein
LGLLPNGFWLNFIICEVEIIIVSTTQSQYGA